MQSSTRHNKHHLYKAENIDYTKDGMFNRLRIKGYNKRKQIKRIRLSKQNMIDEGLKDYEN